MMTPRVTFMIIGVSVFLLTDTLIISAADTPVPKTNDELLSQTKEESDSKHIEGTGYQTDKQDKILTSQSTKQVVSDSCMDMDKECDKTGHIERKKYQGSDKEIHITNVDIEADGDIHTADEVIVEFPKLTRIDPGKVGNVVEVELEDGQFYKRITRSVDPPIFEIPNYLTMKETRFIISAALNNGMVKSEIVGEDINEFFNNVDDIAEIPRVSEQTWVSHEDMPRKISERLRKRLQNLLQLPEIFFEHSELMQVVSYVKKGHYHAHLDTSDTAAVGHLPCCFQVPECLEKILDPVDLESCCRICRYATVLYFLNDVDEGGETAFPLADTTDLELEEKLPPSDSDVIEAGWDNLSYSCHNSSVVVKPKLGTAVMWYNHYIDEEGYLGETDYRTFHGGCDVIKGNKWIANNWIVGSPYTDRKKITT